MGHKRHVVEKKFSPKKSQFRPLTRGKTFFSQNDQGCLKRPNAEKNLARKRSRDVTFQGQGHVISRSLLLILVAYVIIHLCAKFYANWTTRLRVIQMAPGVRKVCGDQKGNVVEKNLCSQKI